MSNVKFDLGLELPDPVEARRTVYEFFDAYRTCRRLLGRHFVEHEKVKSTQGYKYAMNPDDVRVQRVHGGAPKGFTEPEGDEDLLNVKEMGWLNFVRKMDERVNRLHPSQSILIRYRFLDNNPPPSDEHTYAYWCEEGWRYSFRKFEQVKRQAVQMIAVGLDATF